MIKINATMTEQQYDTILRVLYNYRGDDLERAKAAFRGLSIQDMNKQYRESGKTCLEIVQGYENHVAKIESIIQIFNNSKTEVKGE